MAAYYEDRSFIEKAKAQYRKKMEKEIRYLLRGDVSYTGHNLRNVNAIVLAAQKMMATQAYTFSSDEIREIEEDLAPLCQLEMLEEIRAYLEPRFRTKRFEQDILNLLTAKTPATA